MCNGALTVVSDLRQVMQHTKTHGAEQQHSLTYMFFLKVTLYTQKKTRAEQKLDPGQKCLFHEKQN